MKTYLLKGAALAALVVPGMALAQSTGSVDFEKQAIVVTATSSTRAVAGVQQPNTSKAKAVLTQEFIAHQNPGQTVNDIINQLPGVSFQNNDPFGSAGGTMTIRGFDSSRISQTFDGVPLNDSGNYALFSNQQIDPELIDQVNVNLGTTDVDSPTASASGSTVNLRTRKPYDDFGLGGSASLGDYNFRRFFGVIDTGAIGPWGTKAFASASTAKNDNVYNRFGKINKQQYNGKLYQPLGANGDFISLSGHYNQNRNNFFGSVPLRTDQLATTVVPNRFPTTKAERFYVIPWCGTNQVARAGIADTANTCGSTFDERYNPSNTGNVRVQSRFTLADGLVLTVDPSFQYVKANGGGSVVGREGRSDVDPSAITNLQSGYIGGTPFFNKDLNGDGDLLDTIRLLAPSQTITHRYGVISSLRYDINDHHTVRISYSLDHAKHRQTGEVGALDLYGRPLDVFPVNSPMADVSGNILEKRDRLSYAILNQVSGEYRGEFFDDKLVTTLGLRAPFFKRDLTNNCFTTSATGNVNCFTTNTTASAAYAAANPAIQGPQQRVLKYDKLLPNVGLTYAAGSNASIFANYSKGLQVPGTDNLYNSFFFAANTPDAQPEPETTDNFDAGVRYNDRGFQLQVSGWYTKYSNRLASAYDPVLNVTVYRNLGTVNKYGIDGSLAYSPIKEISFYVFGSYLHSQIDSNVQLSGGTAVGCGNSQTSVPVGCAATAGKRESGSPVYTFGGRVQGNLGPLLIGAQVKRTGERYVNDQNLPLLQTVGGVANTIVYGAKTPAYTLVDLDARLSMTWAGLNDRTYLQLNVTNLFDQVYVGGFTGGLSNTSVPFVQIGAPRAVVGSVVFAF